MKKISLSILAILFYVSLSFAQNSLNAYKYIIIPKKYDFLKAEDQYKVNSLTKFLFEKKGFKTVFEGESYPSDLIANPCLGVTSNVIDDSGMFTTKLNIELVDCYSKVVFTSVQGKSKEKEYKKTYHEALRNAFVSIEGLNYEFSPDLVVNMKTNVEAPKETTIAPQISSVEKDTIVSQVREESSKTESTERIYKNNSISFLLIEVGNGFTAYVNQSNDVSYKKGEKIGDLTKTSLPNVYRISWKDENGNFNQTTGHIDEAGNLNIDVNRGGKIEVLIFEAEN